MAVEAGPFQAALALHRFGLGPRPGGIAAISTDPQGALLAELKAGAGRISGPDLPTSGEAARAAFAFRQQRRDARLARRQEAADAARSPTPSSGPAADPPGMGDEAGKAGAPAREAKPTRRQGAGPGVPQQIYLAEAEARFRAALRADIGFVERLVWFWSNHFCVSADKGPVRPLCGAYEREAIRPHVLGRFADMLHAVETHPAMLLYLDNARSIGPNSFAGLRRGKGLNENLAREILELHTLGVRTVYTQEDVTNFAKVITGWSIVPPRRDPERGGEFFYNDRMHEPGDRRIAGRTYPDRGFAQGRAVLDDLARHPATARHVATKLARHFVADAPPPALVDKLTKRFLDTGGDLLEVAKLIATAPESWAAPRTKLKRPGEWTIATLRMIDVAPRDVRRVVQAYNLLGEPLWRPPAPKGFSDDSAAWLDGLAQRLDIANQIGRVAGNGVREPASMLDDALGPLASRESREAVARAESRPQALALLMMAPEFQRR